MNGRADAVVMFGVVWWCASAKGASVPPFWRQKGGAQKPPRSKHGAGVFRWDGGMSSGPCRADRGHPPHPVLGRAVMGSLREVRWWVRAAVLTMSFPPRPDQCRMRSTGVPVASIPLGRPTGFPGGDRKMVVRCVRGGLCVGEWWWFRCGGGWAGRACPVSSAMAGPVHDTFRQGTCSVDPC